MVKVKQKNVPSPDASSLDTMRWPYESTLPNIT